MHLAQVGAISQPPRLGQLAARAGILAPCRHLQLVQEPRHLGPAMQPRLQLDPVRVPRPEQYQQLRRRRLLADGLTAQEHGDHRLLQLAVVETGRVGLDLARLGKLAFDDRTPLLVRSGVGVHAGEGGQLAWRLRQIVLARRTQKHVRPDQRAAIPPLRIPQGDRERPQDAARALESVDLRPPGVEDLGELRVKRVAVVIALLGGSLFLGGLFVEHRDAAHRRRNVRPEHGRIPYRLRREKATPQHLRHVLLADRTGIFLHLAAEHLGHVAQQLVAEGVMLPRIGGEQRRDHRAAVHLDHRLGEVLEKADQPAAPTRVGLDQSAEIHQDFIEQHQRRETPGLRLCQQLRQQRFRGRGLPFGVLAVCMDQPQPGGPRELPCQHAPGMPEHPHGAIRAGRLHALFQVDLVEAQRRDAGLRHPETDMGLELLYRRQRGDLGRGVHQVAQSDQRVGLAAAVVDGELAVRLVAASDQT